MTCWEGWVRGGTTNLGGRGYMPLEVSPGGGKGAPRWKPS